MFTIYNEEDRKFQLVEEPDPSLSYTYADYLQWNFEEQVELIRGKIFKMSPAPTPRHQQISVLRANFPSISRSISVFLSCRVPLGYGSCKSWIYRLLS